MENPEEILHSLEEFSKLRPKSIPRELEEYLCFVAKTGDPVYQWSVIKCLFREKLINVITEFYESCPSVNIPSCRNVDIFNYDTMKTFILEKLDTFVAAPFTVQRICELLTTPRKEYNRIDKYMRALEKNILVVSTTEPGNHHTPENGDGFVNGVESDPVQDGSHDINIEEIEDPLIWPPKNEESYQSTSKEDPPMDGKFYAANDNTVEPEAATSQTLETVICFPTEEQNLVPVVRNSSENTDNIVSNEDKVENEIQDAISENTGSSETVPAVVQRRRRSIEPAIEQSEETQAMPTEDVTEVVEQSTEVTVEKPDMLIGVDNQELQVEISKGSLHEESLKETHFAHETTDPNIAAEDAPLDITEPSHQDNNELSEQVEIDVTSFTTTKPETLEAESTVMQEECMPPAEELTTPMQQDAPNLEEDKETTQIPQVETPIDIMPSVSSEPQEPEVEDPSIEPQPAAECSEYGVMDNVSANETEPMPETLVTSTLPLSESPQIVPVEPPEENEAIAISYEQKVLETQGTPDVSPEIVENPTQVVETLMETEAMEVDTTETPVDVNVVEAPSGSTDSADSNN